jgi:threonine dehydrogenase-like Zn-dependent dehydrogenase
MRGAWIDDGHVRLRSDLAEPPTGVGEIVLSVRLAGICDTDLQLARGYMGFRGVPGHEFVAVTADGRRVTAEINAACHACPTCRAGRPRHCPNRTVLGILGRHGAMADRVAVPERNLHAIPDTIDDRRAVFIEPLAAALHATEQVDLSPGTRAAVLGDGKLGLLCAWAARDAGADVTWIGKHPAKLALAGDGVATCLLGDTARHARAFDVVVEATGSTNGLPTALDVVRPCGSVVLKTTIAAPHQLSLAPVVIDEVRVIGSRCGPFKPAIAALADGRFPVERLIEAEYPLADVEAAFAAAARPGARKILLRVATEM